MRLLAIETSSPIGSIALRTGNDIAERVIATPREQSDLVLPHIDDLLAAAGLQLTELDALVLGRGPGSFTGLRIAAAVVQGLAFAADLPVVSVSSLAALAQRAWREHDIANALLCVDARMREVYVAHYTVRAERARLVGDERLVSPEQLTVEYRGDGAFDSGTDASDDLEKARREGASKPERGGGDEGAEKEDDEGGATLLLPERWAAVGDGWEKYRDVLTPVLERASGVMHDLWPSARDLLPGAAEEYAAGQWLTPERALPVYLRDERAWRK